MLACGPWASNPVPPQPNRLMADVDAALEQQVIDVSQGEGVFTYIMTTSRITSGELSK